MHASTAIKLVKAPPRRVEQEAVQDRVAGIIGLSRVRVAMVIVLVRSRKGNSVTLLAGPTPC